MSGVWSRGWTGSVVSSASSVIVVSSILILTVWVDDFDAWAMSSGTMLAVLILGSMSMSSGWTVNGGPIEHILAGACSISLAVLPLLCVVTC